ncbi:MAG: ABC transporter ATP-binding protein [Clostridiales bacterium]|nr:ABC transporter ATP-binding protein [Clostridiales bacterium]
MSDRKDEYKNPFSEYDKKTRRKFKQIAKNGNIPEEIIGTKDEKVIRKQIKQNEGIKKGWGVFVEFIKKHKSKYILGIMSVIAVNGLAILTPIIIGEIVDMLRAADATTMDSTVARLLIFCIVLVGIAVGKLVANFLARYYILGASNLLEYVMRKKMFNKLINLSINYFNKKSAGEIMALSTNDLKTVRMAIGRGIMMITNAIVLLGSGVIYLSFKMSFGLTIGIMIPFPFMIFMITKFSKFIQTRFRKVQETFSDLTAKTEENISGIRIVKSFVQEDMEIENFMNISRTNYEANVSLAKIMAIFHPSLSFLSTLAYLVMLVLGGFMAVGGAISLGEFIAANAFLGMLIRPIRFIGMLISQLQQGRVSLGRISDMIFEEPDIYDGKFGATNEEVPERFSGQISIKKLAFKYPNKDEMVLNGISTEIESGMTVAVIGEVGSGKTTFANLLTRIFDVEGKGMIAFDGFDITEIPLKTLRANIGYVPQDNFLFSDTISYNIGFSEEGYSNEEIEAATIKSNVYGNIIEFPNKFETMLGEKGVNLSGGQKQRLCIARALIKEAPILILDDSLSSVDVETEKNILANLKDVRAGRTCIIISHRISTIKDSDKIIVLKDGLIAEEGSHDELIAEQGIYDRMYRMQLIEEMEINGGEAS